MNFNVPYGSHSKAIFFLLFAVFSVTAQNKVRDLGVEAWTFRKLAAQNWFPAKIPGTVHTDLWANNLIPDPFFSANEKQLQWIENESWEYRTAFLVSKEEKSKENCILQFDGLDTYAEVFLNGHKILGADNMFRVWKVDVKKHLKEGENTLRVVFASAVKKGKADAQKLPYTLPGDEKVFTRKAQYHYGWDWGPRFVTAGIWKAVSLRFWELANILKVSYRQKKLTDDVAELEFTTIVQATKSGSYQLKINDKILDATLHKGENAVVSSYQIKKPKRWWPNGSGKAELYPFAIILSRGADTIAQSSLEIGLRTIELVREKDAAGQGFYFRVNGVPVFMKGANYIPPDSFLPRAKDSVYKAVVENAVAANMNMLRVWGGGVYPDDAFYKACDQNGILVWQDFMFACAMYPGDQAFLDNVRSEVIDNVSRLQNHPSLALWCGNNESDEGWKNWGWQKQYQYTPQQEAAIWNDYQKLFHELIPETLNSLLPQNENRYWPSSPAIGWGHKESLLEGDSHYWGVWWGMEPFETYQKKVGRFMSEYGFQGMPALETFRAFADESDLRLDSDAVKNHQKHPTGYQTISEYMARDYKIPQAFDDYRYVSQLLQADGIKTAIEAHRRARPYCMGTLYWQLNDCWPVTSWSSVDYFGRWKALHYQVKKSFETALISITQENSAVKVVIVNDGPALSDCAFSLQLLDFKGNVLWDAMAAGTINGYTSGSHFEIPLGKFGGFLPSGSVFVAASNCGQKEITALHYFVKPKDLSLTKPVITLVKIDELTIEVSSDVLAKSVMLAADGVSFSDNYFDLLPNRKIRVRLSKPSDGIIVKSLFDALKQAR